MRTHIKSYLLLSLMLGSAALAWAIHPRTLMSDQRAQVELAQRIPSEFGEWKELPQSIRQIVNPQQTAILEEIYTDTLSRSYIHGSGVVVMLSLAYGANQSRDLQVHRPEVCYSAQGFQIISSEKTNLNVAQKNILAMHLVARLGSRNEPITYWVRIGEKVVRGNVEQGFARLGYGVTGIVPDGILFRVSSISPDATTAYAIQKQFITDLLGAVPQETKSYLLGSGSQ